MKISTKSMNRIVKITVYLLIFCCSGFGYYLFAQRVLPKPDPILFAQEMLVSGPGRIKRALFTPTDDIRTVLIGLLRSEKKHISIAIFMLTDPDIAQAVIQAHQRGVEVEVVADRSCAQTQWSKLKPLAEAGIPIYIWPQALDATRAIMHNKCIIFACTLDGRTLLWTGSYNFTKAASQINQENALILEDDELALTYLAQFEHLKDVSELVGAAKLAGSGEVRTRKRSKSTHRAHEEMNFVLA